MQPKDQLYLKTIINYCNDISTAIDELDIDFDAFYASSARRAVLAFFVEQIGETAGKLSKEFRNAHANIDWEAVVNFRHHIAHAYIGVIPDVLWDTVQNDIPELREFCATQLANI